MKIVIEDTLKAIGLSYNNDKITLEDYYEIDDLNKENKLSMHRIIILFVKNIKIIMKDIKRRIIYE